MTLPGLSQFESVGHDPVATLPRDLPMDDITLEQAVTLLAEKGKLLKPRGGKKAPARKAAAPKAATPKVAAPPVAKKPAAKRKPVAKKKKPAPRKAIAAQ